MHSFLRAIGFSKCKTSKDVNKIIKYALENGETRKMSEDEEAVFGLIEKKFSDCFGLHIFGEYDENDEFKMLYYYPYFESDRITTYDVPTIEKLNANEAYTGVCEDLKVGVSLIFYLQNIMEYKNEINSTIRKSLVQGVIFTGLSSSGKILFPIMKNEYAKANKKSESDKRMNLIAAARNGDEEAIENLTLEDIDTYSMVSRRILNEDIFSIVETYFMPYGIECDMYSVLGDILNYEVVENSYTKEKIVIMTINCNDLIFDVCINEEDLMGEPKVGRRFKGNIWLQGKIAFSDM